MPGNQSSNSSQRKPGRRRAGLMNVSTVLSKMIGKFGLEQRMKEHAFMSLWPDIVDQPFKKTTRPLFIDCEGNLVVAVKDSAVAQELSFLRGQVLKALAPFARGVGLKISGIRFDLKNFKDDMDEDQSLNMLALSRAANIVPEASAEDLAEIELTAEQEEDLEAFKENLKANTAADLAHTVDRIVRLYERELRLGIWRQQIGLSACSQCQFVDSRLYGVLRLCRLCHVMSIINSQGVS